MDESISIEHTFWKLAQAIIHEAMANYYEEEPEQGAMEVSVMALLGHCRVKEMQIKRSGEKSK